MFGHLVDGADDPPVEVAPPPPAAACCRRRGREAGYQHGDTARVKISRARCFNQLQAVTQTTAARLGSWSVAQQMLRNAFGGGRGGRAAGAAGADLRDVVVDSSSIAIKIRQRRNICRDDKRCIVSHIEAQAEGLCNFISRSGIRFVNCVHILDDASMWVHESKQQEQEQQQDMPQNMGDDDDIVRKKLKHSLDLQGQMRHLPVLNSIERIVKLQETSSGDGLPSNKICGVTLFSPARPMPAANWSTVFDRLAWWSVNLGHYPGSGIDPSSRLMHVVEPCWKNISIVKDNLQMNENLVCAIERGLAEQRRLGPHGPATETTILNVHCVAHSIALALKPVTKSFPGLSSFIVRVGHLHNSGRASQKIMDALSAVVKKRFRFRVALVPPEGFGRWQARNRTLLELTSSSMDLTETQRDEILYFLNGDWEIDDDDGPILHWCLPGCRCGGTKQQAFAHCHAAAKMACGTNCPLALEYRWKNMERAAGVIYRGRAIHNLAGRSWQQAWSQRQIRDAQREVEAGAAAGQDCVASKRIVKAGLVISYMRSDPHGKTLLRFLIIQHPLQRYLNAIFEAEAHTSAFVSAIEDVPDDPHVVETAEYNDKFQNALNSNLVIFSGKKIEAVIDNYFELISDFQNQRWQGLNWQREEQFNMSLRCLCAIGVAWRRGPFYFSQPKFQVLAAARRGVDDLGPMIANLRLRTDNCRDCIGSFATVWLSRLEDPRKAVRERAVACLQVLVASTPASSVAVEQKHLIGQECSKTRSRGRRPCAQALSRKSYLKNVAHHAAAKSERIFAKYFSTTRERKQLASFVRRAAANERTPMSRTAAAKRFLRKRRGSVSRCGPFSEFKRQHWDPSVRPFPFQSAAAVAERKRLSGEWARLPAAQRELYRSTAKHRREEIEFAAVEHDDEAAAAAVASSRRSVRSVLDKKLVAKLKAFETDSAWKGGLGIDCPWLGLNPIFLKHTHTNDEIAAEDARCFRYDPVPRENPRGSAIPESTCFHRGGGVCLAGPEAGLCKTLVSNLDVVLREKGCSSGKGLPALLQISVPQGREHSIMLLDMVGNSGIGSLIHIVMVCAAVNGIAGCYEARDPGDPGSIKTSHQLFRDIILAADRWHLHEEGLSVTCFDFKDALNSKGFRICQLGATWNINIPASRLLKRSKHAQPPADEVPEASGPFGFLLHDRGFVAEIPAADGVDTDTDADDVPHGPGPEVQDEGNGIADEPPDGSDGHDDEDDDKMVAQPPADVVEEAAGVEPELGGPRMQGFSGLEISPSAYAVCKACNQKISKDHLRFRYQFKASSAARDNRAVHAQSACLRRLPAANSVDDYRRLQILAAEPTRTQAELDAIDIAFESIALRTS